MENVNILEEMAKETPKKRIRIEFNKYAMKKYGQTKLQMDNFYANYSKAVKFYKRTNIEKRFLGANEALLSTGVATITSLMSIEECLAGSGVLSALYFLITCCGAVGIIDGGYRIFAKSDEYIFNEPNEFIHQGSLEEQMAYEYCNFKKLVYKK